jgi:hypothetical protein
MSSAIAFDVSIAPMPLNEVDTPINLVNAMVRRMKGVLPGSNDSSHMPLLGTSNSTEPTSDVGLWFKNNTFYGFDPAVGKYLTKLALQNSGFTNVLTAGPTANRTVTFNDKSSTHTPTTSNTVAYLADIYIPRTTVLEDTSISPNLLLNADASETFLFRLYQNSTILYNSPTHVLTEGRKIQIWVLNLGTDYTLTWDASWGIKWAGGSAPVVPTSGSQPGGVGLGLFIIRNIHGVIYGSMKDASPATPSTDISTGAVPRNYGGSGNIPRNNQTNKLP